MAVVLRSGDLPADSFAVVMATGIVSVAARDNGYPLVSVVLAVAAVATLAVLATLAGLRFVRTGRAFARGPDPLTHTFGLFTFVAACDVLDARLGPGRAAVAIGLGGLALAAWLLLVPRLVTALRTAPRPPLRDGARGSWLLAAVGTHSLALTAAQLARSGAEPGLLLGLSLGWWLLGLLAYAVIAVAVVRRLLATHLCPDLLTPDTWVLMGALAIGTLSGATLLLGARESGGYSWLAPLLQPVLLVVWAGATAWVPLLLAGELRRARRVRPRYERSRWATVFPLGMYSAACAVLAVALSRDAGGAAAFPAVLRSVSHVAFWVAVTAWCATAFGLARLGRRVVVGRSSTGGRSVPP